MSAKIPSKNNSNYFFALLLLIALVDFVAIAFFNLRSQFTLNLGFYSLLFIAILRIIDLAKKRPELIKFALIAAIFLRIIVLFAFPFWSDDIHRFLWDGLILNAGVNPLTFVPSDYFSGNVPLPAIDGLNKELYSQLNSPDYYTIYPPVCQITFYIASFFYKINGFLGFLVLKSFMLAFEIGSLILMGRLLKLWSLPAFYILIYALNPLVILELCGNIHYEAGMIFFCLGAIYLLVKKRLALSAISMTLAVATKMIPLIFLPLLIKRLGLKKSISYFAIMAFSGAILFTPFLFGGGWQHLQESIGLYFQKFEFNASLYYLLRWVGFQLKGWNVIQTLGPYLGLATFASILTFAYLDKDLKLRSLPSAMMWALGLYLLFATIVHPWYITPLLAFSIFTKYRFALLWTFLIFLSYATYQTNAYHENLWLVLLEYLLLFGFLAFELSGKRWRSMT